MSIRGLILFGFEKDAAEHITGTFNIHHFDVTRLPDDNSALEIENGLRVDIQGSFVRGFGVHVVDFDPELHYTLCNRTRLLIQVPILDWFVLDCEPALRIEPIIQINLGNTNQIVTEKCIVVVCLDCETGGSGEVHLELIAFEELRLVGINLVVFALIELVFATMNLQERI